MVARFRKKQMIWAPLNSDRGFPDYAERKGEEVTVTQPVNGIDHLFEVEFADGVTTRGFEFELKPVPRKKKTDG
jgi:hypothetical protein